MQLNKTAACFFLPMKGKKYQGYGVVPHDVVADDLLNANFLDVYGCMLFFCQLFNELIETIITYSPENKVLMEKAAHLWRVGGGSFKPNKWRISTT
jgi:hypothetical protein